MATLSRTTSLGTSVTRQDLYDLINKSTLSIGAFSPAGVGSVVASTNPPTAFTASTWWFDQETQLLRVPLNNVDGSGCSLWLSVGPDSWETPVYNASASVLARGLVVGWCTAANCGIYDITPTIPYAAPSSASMVQRVDYARGSRNIRSTVGALQATLPANSWGLAVFRGFGYALCKSQLIVAARAQTLSMSTTFTAALEYFNDNGLFPGFPTTCGVVLNNPATTFASPVLLPVFMYMPFTGLQ
jgi:hypothetical protein